MDITTDTTNEELRQRIAELEAKEARHQQIAVELEARLQQQAVVAQLGQRVLAGASLPTLFEEAVILTAKTLRVPFCQIFELLPDRDVMVLTAGSGWDAALFGNVRVDARTDSHLGYTLFSSEPVIVEDLETDPRFTENALLQERQIVSGISVIIDGAAWPFGVLSIHSTSYRIFDEHDIHFLQAVANVLATAIEHRRTQEVLQEARDELEMRVRERTAELEAANEELKTFAYIVSHDLRAPLVNIKGFAGELTFSLETIHKAIRDHMPVLPETEQRALTFALEEDIPEAMEFINTSVSRMDYLLAAILKLSRLGRRDLNFETVDMDALVRQTLKTMAHQIEQHDAEVTIQPLPRVTADLTTMEQIIGNILTNAVKYLEPDRAGEIEISSEYSRDETLFHIRDNGRGIAEGDMHKVFELFRRAGRPTVSGEGVGLAYVRTMVRRHGGRIWCDSTLGEGTTFTFTISNHLTS